MMRGCSAPRDWLYPQITQNPCNLWTKTMNRFLLLIVILSGSAVYAQDITTLEKIGPVVSLQRSDKGVTLNCQDNSQVQISVLAPDLIRVRASFTKPIPARDHSWAIAKENWTTPPFNLS